MPIGALLIGLVGEAAGEQVLVMLNTMLASTIAALIWIFVLRMRAWG